MKTLSLESLKTINACQEAIDFMTNNNLLNFPINKIDDITGDYNNFVAWIKNHLEQNTYDSQNNKTASKNPDEYWIEWTYDSHNNKTSFKDSDKYSAEWKFVNTETHLIIFENNTESCSIPTNWK